MYCKVFPSLGRTISCYRHTPRSINLHPRHTDKTNIQPSTHRAQAPPRKWCDTFPITRASTTRTYPHPRRNGRVPHGWSHWLPPARTRLAIPCLLAWIWTPTRPMDCFIRTIWLRGAWHMVSEWWGWARLEVAFPSRGFWNNFSPRFWCTRDDPCCCWIYFNCFWPFCLLLTASLI